ncbi:1-aminocyclopropane-1-carboxylate deaminase/D-cysteine desulfhydrase [Aurantibacter aestuarii]|uniref:1-aminocyclopropane-1-carboxylate deaminase n=1 Tax=Aurantibacter aestuarii TaxID=1266046 RepID=A0A2T1NC85_9FLAO|nr:pyridoxal-phosphate dependent enzyme [Aurantibacter aestuarii]PSG90056.1 1-aminocyclopropane-1-carboxylate deaminase [Aurantibacter aestuarii]
MNTVKNLTKIRLLKNNLLKNTELFIKREDLLHKYISGNKFRKLKYNFEYVKNNRFKEVITFGGAYSNHISATAYAGKLQNIQTFGIIRGEELENQTTLNYTLNFAKDCGMNLIFVSREDYKKKDASNKVRQLINTLQRPYIIPEGGTNNLAIKGCEEILGNDTKPFDYICTSVGTGGTISGLINASESHQEILGFSALKGDFLSEDISKFVSKTNWKLNTDYHFGGYGKISEELIHFMNDFKKTYDIPLDPIYTGKMMFGIIDLIKKGYFKQNAKILAIHTGGLQGIEGMNETLKLKKLPLIQ